MHAKNTNFFEQHVEKIILAVGAVVAIVIAFIYVLGEPYSVDLGGKETAPSEVAERVKRPLDALKRALADPDAPEELDITMAPRAQWFSHRQNSAAGGAVAMTIPFGGSQGLDKTLLNAERQAQERYVLPLLPGPTGLLARGDHAVLLGSDELEDIFAQPNFILDEMAEQIEMNHGREVAAQFAQLVPDESPRDFQFVSVMAEFDWEDWRKALEEAVGPTRLPVEWWQQRTFFVDVILERQVWNEASGAWGSDEGSQFVEAGVETVPLLPGSMSFRDPSEEVNPRELRARVAIPFVQQQIMQPTFAPIEGGWLRPDEQPKERDAKEERRLMVIDQQIRGLERRQQDLFRKISAETVRERDRAEASRLREARDRRTESTRREAGSDRRSNRPSGRKTTTSGRSPATAAVPRKTQAQRLEEANRELNVKLAKLHLERDVLMGLIDEEEALAMQEDQANRNRGNRSTRPGETGSRTPNPGLTDPSRRGMPMPGAVMGGYPGGGHPAAGFPYGGGMPGPGGMPSMGSPAMPGMGRDLSLTGYGSHHFRGGTARTRYQRRAEATQTAEALAATTKVTVWAHDMTVTPGEKYRYRLRVAVYNPLFQKHDRLVDELDTVADALGWTSEPSAWTDGVQIHPRFYFFLVAGNKRAAEATIEVYCLFNGRWQREEFDVQPGDTLGGKRNLQRAGIEREVDLSLGVLGVDIDPQAQSQVRATRQTVKLIYLDLEDNALQERTVEGDLHDPIRMRLHNLTEIEQQVEAMDDI